MPRTEIKITPNGNKEKEIIADVLDAEGIKSTWDAPTNSFYIDEDTTKQDFREIEALIEAQEVSYNLKRVEAEEEDRSQDWYGRSADTEEWHG